MNAAIARANPLPLLITAGAVLLAALLGYAATSGSPLILIGVLALVALAAILWDWTLGVPLLLTLSATDGFIKHYSSSTATYVLKDALLAVLLLSMALRLGTHPADRPAGTRWRGFVVWCAYIGFLATQLVHPIAGISDGIGAFRAHAGFAILFVVGAVYFQHRERLPRIANLAIALCAFCALTAVVQQHMGQRWVSLSPGFTKASMHYMAWPSEALRVQGISAGTFRMYGTLVDPASLGLACTYGILFAIAALARLRGLGRLLTMASIPLMATGLALSQARADMAGLGAGMILLCVLSMQVKATRTFAIGGMLLIALAIPAGIIATHGTVLDRLLSKDVVAYAQATRDRSRDQVLSELPAFPFGHGLGATTNAGIIQSDPNVLSVDNVFFANLYETGILGLGLFLTLQCTLLVLGIRAARRARDIGAKTAFIGIVAGQSALLFSCWFSQGSFDYAPLAQFFWLFSGAVALGDAWS